MLIFPILLPILIIVGIHYLFIDLSELSILISILIFPWLFSLISVFSGGDFLNEDTVNSSSIALNGYPSSLKEELNLLNELKSKTQKKSITKNAQSIFESKLIELNKRSKWFSVQYQVAITLNKTLEEQEKIIKKAIEVLPFEFKKNKIRKRNRYRTVIVTERQQDELVDWEKKEFDGYDETKEADEFHRKATFWDAYELYLFSKKMSLKEILNNNYRFLFPAWKKPVENWKTRLKIERRIGISIKSSLKNLFSNLSYNYKIKEKAFIILLFSGVINLFTLLLMIIYFRFIHQFIHPYTKDFIDLSWYQVIFSL
jgi:hypothetical protein